MEQQILQLTTTPDTIDAAAAALLEFAGTAKIWAFDGDMGAGKTTLIRSLCRQMGITDPVSSPTFALINEYRLPAERLGATSVLHMDWYRLGSEQEAIQAGMEDALTGGQYCFVEWPGRAEGLLPAGTLRVGIRVISGTERHIEAGR